MSVSTFFSGGPVGIAQKAYDLLGYARHRAAMLLRVARLRRAHQRVFSGRVASILVVRLASIGDVVRATAVLERLKATYPDVVIDMLTSTVAVGMVSGHPALRRVYTIEELAQLPSYDWVINLQNRDPPDSFLRSAGCTYAQVLAHLETHVPHRWMSGRQSVDGQETTPTNVLYCVAEMEEFFLIALLPYNADAYPPTKIRVSEAVRGETVRKFVWPTDRPTMAVFLGSNSIGCGADEGFRTYSIDYLERLIAQFGQRFTVVVIGQSSVRNAAELSAYRALLARHPAVIDLVDKTSLEELAALMDRMALLVSTDSSPVHIALACGVPVVGLYVSDATFRMSPRVAQETFIALNSQPPCFGPSWRWRFFCESCRDSRTRARYCDDRVFAFGVDRIPVAQVAQAADSLLAGARHR